MKYGLPTEDGKTVGTAFGRAKSFAIWDAGTSSFEVVANEGIGAEHGAGTGAASFLAGKGVVAVIASEVGPKAADALRAAGIDLAIVPAGTPLAEAARGYVTTRG